MALISISGKAGSGKDTLASMIQHITSRLHDPSFGGWLVYNHSPAWLLDSEKRWQIKHWGAKVKEIASLLTGVPLDHFYDRELKESPLDSKWDYPLYHETNSTIPNTYTLRSFLQQLGTEAIRNNLHPNAWVNALLNQYLPYYGTNDTGPIYPNWLIPDTRFPNEIQAVVDRGGLTILIERPSLVLPEQEHISETALDNYREWDAHIVNHSLHDLYENAIALCKNWKLCK